MNSSCRSGDATASREQVPGSLRTPEPRGIRTVALSGHLALFRIENLDATAAAELSQTVRSQGGDVYCGGEQMTDALVIATKKVLSGCVDALRMHPSAALQQVAAALDRESHRQARPESTSCRIGARDFLWGSRTYVMGIVNVTPDSFSGDGLLSIASSTGRTEVETAIAQAISFVKVGADILDVGGESTRPGALPLEAEAELDRVVPVIAGIRALSDVPISIDTYKARVAHAALDAGADLVNDIWGLKMDPDMAPLVAERRVPIVLMHNRSKARNALQQKRLGGRYVGVQYHDLVADIIRELQDQLELAVEMGIRHEQIIIDPGIGFGKTVEQNLQLLNHVDEFRVLGCPVLLGPSRKSFIGYTLNLAVDERLEGTAAAVAVGIARAGVDIVRVHDVGAMVRVVRMTDAIMRAG